MFFLATTYALKHKMIMLCSAAARFLHGAPSSLSEFQTGLDFPRINGIFKDGQAIVVEVNLSTPINAT